MRVRSKGYASQWEWGTNYTQTNDSEEQMICQPMRVRNKWYPSQWNLKTNDTVLQPMRVRNKLYASQWEWDTNDSPANESEKQKIKPANESVKKTYASRQPMTARIKWSDSQREWETCLLWLQLASDDYAEIFRPVVVTVVLTDLKYIQTYKRAGEGVEEGWWGPTASLI